MRTFGIEMNGKIVRMIMVLTVIISALIFGGCAPMTNDAGGNGGNSGDTTPPSVPQGLTVTQSGPTISWHNSTDDNEVSYYLVYRNDGKKYLVMETSFVDMNVVANVTYSYQVSAADTSDNESARSQAVSVRILPSKPENPATETKTHKKVKLSWEESPWNAGTPVNYRVYVNGVQHPEELTQLSLELTGLTPLSTYTFWVTTVRADDSVESPPAEITATTASGEVKLYFPNYFSSSVTVYYPQDGRTEEIDLTKNIFSERCVVNSNIFRAYVVGVDIAVINTVNDSLITLLPFVTDPYTELQGGLAIDPVDNFIYISMDRYSPGNFWRNEIHILDGETNTFKDTIIVLEEGDGSVDGGGINNLLIHPEKREIYAFSESGWIYAVNMDSHEVAWSVYVRPGLRSYFADIDFDSDLMYFADTENTVISVIDLNKRLIVSELDLSDEFNRLSGVVLYQGFLYAGDIHAKKLFKIRLVDSVDTSTWTIEVIDIEGLPFFFSMDPLSKNLLITLFTGDYNSGLVAIIDPDSFTVQGTFTTGAGPGSPGILEPR